MNERKLVRLHDRIWAVQGDTSRYLVCVPDLVTAQRNHVPVASCTCEARAVCSHLLAANAVEKHLAGGGVYP